MLPRASRSRLRPGWPPVAVIDIGSNDGTLLSNFTSRGPVHGIEPTNAGNLANQRNIPTLISFFNRKAVGGGQRFKIGDALGAQS